MEFSSLPTGRPAEALELYYRRLLGAFGPQGWWPARTRLEVILGAILTQNTTWRNAALALNQLRGARLLGLPRLRKATRGDLEASIRPAGFFRQKARTIRAFLDWLESACGGSLEAMFARPAVELRRSLLEIKGLGPETVDSILLYAGRQPFFVADAYSRRVLARHGWLAVDAGYAATQGFFHQHLPADHALFNEYHALLVEVGKRYCRRLAPRCEGCPLGSFLPAAQSSNSAARDSRADTAGLTAEAGAGPPTKMNGTWRGRASGL